MRYTLVTGGAGFLGSNLCRRLLAGGQAVICADDFSTGSRENVRDLLSDGRFVLTEADVAAPDFCERVLAAAGAEGIGRIYHLACPASPVRYQVDPIRTAKTCFLGSLAVLELALHENARVLLASTSEVYGDPLEHPQRESYRGNVNPDGPRACYDEGKRISETLFFDAQRSRGADIRVVRIFNTYGPYMAPDDGRVVSNFILQALRGEDITLYGDGSQTRSFCYVDDMLDGFEAMMEQDGFYGPVNLGNPEEYTVRQVAELVTGMTGSSSRIRRQALPADDPSRRRPDISLAKEVLGFAPRIPFREGLARTVAYYRERYGL